MEIKSVAIPAKKPVKIYRSLNTLCRLKLPAAKVKLVTIEKNPIRLPSLLSRLSQRVGVVIFISQILF